MFSYHEKDNILYILCIITRYLWNKRHARCIAVFYLLDHFQLRKGVMSLFDVYLYFRIYI